MPFVCQHCNAQFASCFFLMKHMKTNHCEVALFKCPSCDESFTTESIMMEHKDRVHKDKVPVQLEIEYHQTGKPIYPCGKCEKEFKSKPLLAKHLVKAHPSFVLMYKCPLCSHSVRYRKQHMRAHHYLEYDSEQHHFLVHYKCHCCSKLFQQQRELLDHQNALPKQCGRCQMRFKTKKSLRAHIATHQANKSFKCEDCGLDCRHWSRLQEHRERYHSPTSTQVVKIINCPFCPKLFASPSNRARHIAFIHGKSESKVNCGHCPVQVTNTVLLRKHYKTVHPEEQVTFKCPECERFYLKRNSFQTHCRKHRKKAAPDEKAEMNSTSKPLEDGLKDGGQMNDQNADGELISIVIKEEAIVHTEKASAGGVGATTRINDNSLNSSQPSEQGMMLEIKQEPLDNGEPTTSTTTIEEKKSAAEGTSERKSVMIEKQKATREPVVSEQSELEQQVVHTESDTEEKSVLLLTEKQKQEEHMEVDEAIDKFVTKTPVNRSNKPFKCQDCGLFFPYRCRLEAHRQRYHNPTSTKVLKIINCPYCPELFNSVTSLKSHITNKHVRSALKCQDCGLFFPYRCRLEAHRQRYHNPTSTKVLKTINCPYCPELFNSVTSLKSHITNKHVRSAFKVNCGHCPVQVTATKQLRKHYKTVHPEEQVTFKCPECEKFYLRRDSFQTHYMKHRKKAAADEKAEMNSTSKPLEDGLKEGGQMNDQNADGDLISIVIKEEAIVHIENASAAAVGATTGINDNSLNTNHPLEHEKMVEIKQEPLDSEEPATSTVLTEEEKSTDAEGTSEQKSVMNSDANIISKIPGRI